MLLRFLLLAILSSGACTKGTADDRARRGESKAQPAPNAASRGDVTGNDEDALAVMPASVGGSRVKTAGLDRASEDMTSLLTPPKPRPTDDEPFEDSPDPAFHYLIDLELAKPTSEDEVLAAFTQEWFAALEYPVFYGRLKAGPWATPRSRSKAGPYDHLVLGIELYRRARQEPVASLALLQNRLAAIDTPAKLLGVADIKPRETAEAATVRARQLGDIIQGCYLTASVVVKAQEGQPHKAHEIWDVMNSLGLKWGSLDLFHWNVQNVGEDLFRVWTTTAPEYFLPEAAAEGATYDDIVFEFEVHHADAPLKRLTEMLRAARYAHKRLGGTLTDGEMEPFIEQKLRDDVEKSVRCLDLAGYQTGTLATRLLFLR